MTIITVIMVLMKMMMTIMMAVAAVVVETVMAMAVSMEKLPYYLGAISCAFTKYPDLLNPVKPTAMMRSTTAQWLCPHGIWPVAINATAGIT